MIDANKKGTNSELVHRVRNRSYSGKDYFLENHNIYSEEANKILADLNLVYHKDQISDEERIKLKDDKKLVMHYSLVVGKHYYKVLTTEYCK